MVRHRLDTMAKCPLCEFVVYRCNHEDENRRRCPIILYKGWQVHCQRKCKPEEAAIIENDAPEYCNIHKPQIKKKHWWKRRGR